MKQKVRPITTFLLSSNARENFYINVRFFKIELCLLKQTKIQKVESKTIFLILPEFSNLYVLFTPNLIMRSHLCFYIFAFHQQTSLN